MDYRKYLKFLTEHWSIPFLSIFIVWMMFAGMYFFSGTVPFPSDYQVSHFPPWSSYPEYAGPVKNNAMPDIIDQIYPWRHFSIEQLRNGSLPLWNPNNFAGNPHIANFQSAAFSPFNLLFLLLPFLTAWSLMVLFQPLIAGLSMYVFVRSYKVSKIGSLIAAISFMFCGFIVVWMAYGTLSMAISILPFLLFCIKRYIDTDRFYLGFLISLALAFSFFSGHFQTSLYVLAFSAAFAVFLSISKKKPVQSFKLFSFLLLGVGIASVQLLPTIQFYLLSPRNESFITGGGIPWNYFITLIAPDFYGNPVTRNDWFGYYAEWASFVGIIPLILCGMTLFLIRNRMVRFYWGAILVLLFLVISSPVQAFLGSLRIPVLSTSNPSRIIVLLSFSLAFLSGYGFDEFLIRLKNQDKRIFLPILSLGGIVFAVWAVLLLTPFSQEYTALAKRNFILPTALFLSFSIVTVFLFFKSKNKVITSILLIGVLGFVIFDSIRFVTKWMPVGNSEFVFPSLAVIEEMQSQIVHGRVFGNIGAQITTYYNLPGIEGYDPLYIDRYGQFVNASRDGLFHSSERSVVNASPNGKYIDRLLDITGVKLMYHPISDTNQSWAYPVWEDVGRFEEVYKDDAVQLFVNKSAIPRGTLYFSYEVITDDREILRRFYSEDFDFRNTLILEKDPGIPVSEELPENASVIFREDKPRTLVFQVSSPREGLLFLSDNYYPGWKAYVNGIESEIFRANFTFRAVRIPSGDSIVEFRYQFLL